MFKTSTFRVAAILAGICLCGPAWALGSTPVTVVNPADIAKAEGIQQPYSNIISCSFDKLFGGCGAAITAPPSQRLVIEFVSGFCQFSNASNSLRVVQLFIKTGGGDEVGNVLSIQAPGTISQLVRLYADPSSEVRFDALAFSGVSGGCFFTVSGQAVAVP
jgi:hypothetical protein